MWVAKEQELDIALTDPYFGSLTAPGLGTSTDPYFGTSTDPYFGDEATDLGVDQDTSCNR